MQLVDSCQLPPGCCFISRRSDGRLLDTLQEVDGIGRIYLHEQVVLDAITMFGGLQPHEVQPLRDELVQLRAQVADLEQELDDFDALRTSVARTLKDGGTVDRKGRLQMRGLNEGQRKRMGVAAGEED